MLKLKTNKNYHFAVQTTYICTTGSNKLTCDVSLYLQGPKKLALYWKHNSDATKKIRSRKVLMLSAENKILIYKPLNSHSPTM